MWSKLICRVLRNGAGFRRFPRGGDRVRKFSPSYGTRQNHVRQEWKPFSLAPSCCIAIPNLQPKDLTHCSQILDHATNWHCPGYKNQIPVPIVAISLFGRSQDQRIAPTWTNKSHPFRHTQICRLISQIQLQNPSLRIWMLPNQFQSEVSTIWTKSLEKFYLLTGEEIEVKESLKGRFFFPIWIYFPMINYQLFQILFFFLRRNYSKNLIL